MPLGFLNRRELELSTEASSAARAFTFNFTFRRTEKDGSVAGFVAVITREGDNASVTISSLDNVFYCFMTRGMLVRVDSSRPAGLLAVSGGSFHFDCSAPKPEGGINFLLEYHRTEGGGEVMLGISSLLRWASFPNGGDPSIDTATGRVTFHALHTTTDVFPVADRTSLPVPIEEMSMKSSQGWTMAFRIADPAHSSRHVVVLSAEELRAAGVGVEPAETFAGSVSVLPPAGFATLETDREASARFIALFNSSMARRVADDEGERMRDLVRLDLARVRMIVAELGAPPAQQRQVGDLLESHQTQVDQELEKLRNNQETPQQFAHTGVTATRIDGPLSAILGEQNFAEFTRRWRDEPFDDVSNFRLVEVPLIRRAFAKEQSSPDQEGRFNDVLERFKHDYEGLLVRKTGSDDKSDQAKSAKQAVEARFQNGVRQILGDEAYQRYLSQLSWGSSQTGGTGAASGPSTAPAVTSGELKSERK